MAIQLTNRFSKLLAARKWLRLAAVCTLSTGLGIANVGSTFALEGASTDSFLESIKQSALVSETAKSEIVKQFDAMVADGTSTKDAVTQCLMIAYPEYRTAKDALDNDDLATGLDAMQKLTSSENAYLAADASFFLGRAYLLMGQHENAVAPLAKLSSELKDHSLRETESLFYLGTAQAGLLQTDAAMENLIRFLQEDASAPERLKMGAYSQLVKLEKIKKDTLEDAHLRMGYSERRLGLSEPGQETQVQQEKVVSILNKLIEETEKKECSNCKKGGKCNKPGESQKPGQKPGEQPKPSKSQSPGQSSNSNGSATEQSFDNGPISIWSQLRERDRDPANTAVKEKLPPEYRKLIERYYREMSDGSQRP